MLLYFLMTIHTLFWAYVLFGSFVGPKHAAIILYWIIPAVWIVHMLPFHVLGKFEDEMLGTSHLHKSERFKIMLSELGDLYPFLKPWTDTQVWGEDNCIGNPLGAQGMLVLAAIIASRCIRN